jgi:hypothetical protein
MGRGLDGQPEHGQCQPNEEIGRIAINLSFTKRIVLNRSGRGGMALCSTFFVNMRGGSMAVGVTQIGR